MSDPSVGALAYGFHEGGRSEYAVQYALSAFGSAIPVPRQEDCGYDLHCGVGERVGKRLLIRDHYYVQVKSKKEDLVYPDPDSVRWLVSLACPLFVAVVDKAQGVVELFQTAEVPTLDDSVQRVTLTFREGPQFEARPRGAAEATIHLGDPVLRFEVARVEDEETRVRLGEALAFWVRHGHDLITERRAGGLVFPFPTPYEANVRPSGAWTVHGAFMLSEAQWDTLYDRMFKAFGVLLLGVANYRPQDFDDALDAVKALINRTSSRDCWGLRFFTGAIDRACRQVGRRNPWSARSATRDIRDIVLLDTVRVGFTVAASSPAPPPPS
jgi:hypothetical protein